MIETPDEDPMNSDRSVASDTAQPIPIFAECPTIGATAIEVMSAGREVGKPTVMCIVLQGPMFCMSRAVNSDEARILADRLLKFAEKSEMIATADATALLSRVFNTSPNQGEGHGG